MGNHNSRLNSPKLTSVQSPSDEELDITFRDFHLSDKDSDADRLHTYSFLKKDLFQGYFTSPIEDKLTQGRCKILDVGCGPGTWLLCMANEYQNADFIGLDIKPLFPREIKPTNLDFVQADIFDGLPFPDNEFDFTHEEAMAYIFTRDQWDFAFSELIRVTKPGGYIEVVEFYVTYVDSGPIFRKVYQGLLTLALKRNVDITIINELDSIFGRHSNISRVNRDERKVIFGPNGDKTGYIVQDIFISYCTTKTAIISLSTELGMSKEEYKNMIEKDLIEELKQTKPEAHLIRFWAQKNQS